MRANVDLTFDFDEKKHPTKTDDWGDPVIYWQCPNCDTIETSWYMVEERGGGVHTIQECFRALKARIAVLEEKA